MAPAVFQVAADRLEGTDRQIEGEQPETQTKPETLVIKIVAPLDLGSNGAATGQEGQAEEDGEGELEGTEKIQHANDPWSRS